MYSPEEGLRPADREPGLSLPDSLEPPPPQVKQERGDLLLVGTDGREWHVVDALMKDNQMTIITPGTQTAEYRIFKPDIGQAVVYTFTRGDDRSIKPDVLDFQLGHARRLRDEVPDKAGDQR